MILVCPIHTNTELTRLGSCVKCRKRVPGIPKPAPVPTILPGHRADAKPAPKSAIDPETRRKTEDSLATAPTNIPDSHNIEVETSLGTEIVEAKPEDSKLEDPADTIVETDSEEATSKVRLPAAPKKQPSGPPAYIKSVAHPVVPSTDPEAPYGRDENDRPIVPGRNDLQIAIDLLAKTDLAPGSCPHRGDPEYCLLCGTARVRPRPTDDYIEKQLNQRGLKPLLASTPANDLLREALYLQSKKKMIHQQFDFWPEILGITRRQLIGLLDLVVGVEPRTTRKKVLKSQTPLENSVATAIMKAPAKIEELKALIKESEELIESWSLRVMKIRRKPEDILNKPTREMYKREEKKKIDQYKKELSELRQRLPRLDALKQRLTNWGSHPDDYTEQVVTEDAPATFRDKFELSRSYIETHPDITHVRISNGTSSYIETIDVHKDTSQHLAEYIQLMNDMDILRDTSQRFKQYQTIDRWRDLENEIVLQAIWFGLVQPSKDALKKYPELGKGPTRDEENVEEDHDLESKLLIKTGGDSMGATIYGGGTRWNGRQRGLSSFHGPRDGYHKDHGPDRDEGGFSGLDSGDYGENFD